MVITVNFSAFIVYLLFTFVWGFDAFDGEELEVWALFEFLVCWIGFLEGEGEGWCGPLRIPKKSQIMWNHFYLLHLKWLNDLKCNLKLERVWITFPVTKSTSYICRAVGTINRGSVSFIVRYIFWLINILCGVWFLIIIMCISITCNTNVDRIVISIANVCGCTILICSRRWFNI